MRVLRRLLGVLVLVAALVAGCSADDRETDPAVGASTTTVTEAAPAEAFSRAADATAAAPAARFRTEWVDMSGSTLAEGVVHPARSALAVTVSRQSVQGSYGSAEAPSDVVVLDRSWYVRGGRASSIAAATGRAQHAPTDWLVVDRVAVGQNAFVATPDLTTLLALLRAANGSSPARVGQEQVRDTPTTHWRAAVTPRVLAAGLGAGAIGGLSVPEVADLTIVAFEVWVDGTGVVRKAEYRVDLAAGGPAAAALDSMRRALIGSPSRTWELWDVGTAPTVEPPASATDVTSALSAPPRRTG